MTYYNIKAKARRHQTAARKYKFKRFVKGRTYTLKRKLTPTQKKDLRKYSKAFGWKIISIKKSI
jgi:hypothetical protein